MATMFNMDWSECGPEEGFTLLEMLLSAVEMMKDGQSVRRKAVEESKRFIREAAQKVALCPEKYAAIFLHRLVSDVFEQATANLAEEGLPWLQ